MFNFTRVPCFVKLNDIDESNKGLYFDKALIIDNLVIML